MAPTHTGQDDNSTAAAGAARPALHAGDLQPWLAARLARWQAFMADPQPGQIMVNLATWDMNLTLPVEARPLESWQFPRDCAAFADYQVRRLRAEWQLTRHVDDDRLPFLNPGIGIALNSLYYADGPMGVSAGTTWRHPVIKEWADLEHLRCSADNPWYRGLDAMNARFMAAGAGDYVVQTFSHFGPLDMANALRGNGLFTDFYDEPEAVHRLLLQCTASIVWLEEQQRRQVPMLAGGTPVWGTWVPGPATFMSEDAADLCSPALYQEFGQPHTAQVAAAGGGAWIHHHAKGFHNHASMARVPGLRCIEISWDPNCPRPIDHLRELFEQNRGLPLMTRCTARDVYALAPLMRAAPLILMLTAPTLPEAHAALRWLRQQ